MIPQARSELLKLRTTRTLGLVLLAAAGLTLLGACVEGLSHSSAELAQEDAQREMFGANVTAVIFATLAGLIAVTAEFRYGTIRPTLLFEPRRRVVLAAKLAASALAGVVLAVVCAGVSFGAASLVLAVRDVDVALTAAHSSVLVYGTIAASVLNAMIGVAIGALIRNQVGAIVALVGYAFLVDAALFAAAPSTGRYLPGKAGDALAGQPTEHLLAPGVGAAVVVGWMLALVVAATVRTDRSDV